MKRLLALIVLLAAAASVRAQNIKLPATVNVPGPGFVIIKPDSVDADAVIYFSLDPGLSVVPPDFQLKDPTKGGFFTMANGIYRVKAVAAKAVQGKAVFSDPSDCVVTVGPPTPPPPPPPPDAFTQAVQAAYAQETSPSKAQQAAYLASVYRGASSLLTPGTTAGTLYQQLSSAIHNPTLGIPAGSLPAVSKVIGNDLDATIAGKPGPVSVNTPVPIDQARAAFAKYAAALSTLK